MPDRAIPIYRSAWERWPNDRVVIGTGAAAALADSGDVKTALRTIEAVLEMAPEDSYALYAGGRIYRLDGQLSAATECQAKAARNSRMKRQAAAELRKVLLEATRSGDQDLVTRLNRLLNL
jgi:tetratricopeptide (TPR) repeat protein